MTYSEAEGERAARGRVTPFPLAVAFGTRFALVAGELVVLCPVISYYITTLSNLDSKLEAGYMIKCDIWVMFSIIQQMSRQYSLEFVRIVIGQGNGCRQRLDDESSKFGELNIVTNFNTRSCAGSIPLGNARAIMIAISDWLIHCSPAAQSHPSRSPGPQVSLAEKALP